MYIASQDTETELRLRFVRRATWVTLSAWVVGFPLARTLDDPLEFLTLALPVLFGLSQLLSVQPMRWVPLWRRAGAAAVSLVFYFLLCSLVLWPATARVPWGIEWTTQSHLLLAIAVAWIWGSCLTYKLLPRR